MADDRTFSAAHFLGQLLALLPGGKAWTREADAVLQKPLAGSAPEFARVQERADQLLLELDPATADEMLDEYEYVNGLPDLALDPITDTGDRQKALVARLRDKTGHNNADYELVATTLGHLDAVVHSRPYYPFRAGMSRAGDRCYGDEWVFLYSVEYMENLLDGTWATSGASIATGTLALNESDDAETVTFSAGGQITQQITGSPGTAQTDIWMRVAAGTSAPVVFDTLNTFGSVVDSLETVVTTNWRRYTLRSEDLEHGVSVFRLSSAAGQDIMIWRPLAGMVDAVLEQRFANIGQSHTVPEFRIVGDYFPNG